MPKPRTHYGLTFFALATGAIAFTLLQSMVSPALPAIQQELGTSTSTVTWVLTGFLLSASVATPILGRLGDMFGKERMLLVALGGLWVGTLIAALASSIEVLIAARFVQGLGGAVFPLSFGIIRDEFPATRVPTGIAMVSAIMGIGAGAGIVLAGPIVDGLSYHWLFWFPLVAITIALVTTLRFVPESPIKTPGRINWPGAFLLSGWLVSLLYGISRASDWGWTSPEFLGLMALAAGLAALWARVELRADEPLIDMRMLQQRGVWTTNLTGLLLGFGMFGSFILIPQLAQLPESTGYGFGASVTQSGLFMLPTTVMMLLVSPVAGRLTERIGPKVPLVIGTALASLSFLLLAVAHGERLDLYLAAALLGAGIGMSFASMANLIVSFVPASQTGAATGMNTITRTVGGSLGAQVLASVLTAHVASTGLPLDTGFTTGFTISAGAVGLAFLAALAVPSPRAATAAVPAPA
ncbi:MFS transporter [Svornostia abyssi]|uniref:MFS transporter n=1 Tax=Svornostia abyssi TaxID=2898438 RepID=A0ABY5PDJ5_9ACTN|nr:MFS transporter [Parviterribacteraceae bacterium J379]